MVNPGLQDDEPLQSTLLKYMDQIQIKAVMTNKDGSELTNAQVKLKEKIEGNWLNLNFHKVTSRKVSFRVTLLGTSPTY